jgi:DNA-binding NarL/FixJ family response regulator
MGRGPDRIADLGVDHVLLDITAPIDDQIEAMRQLLKLTTVV